LARQIVALSSGVAHADIARTVRSHLMRSNESVSRSNGKTHASGAKVGRRSVHMAQ
jgi:hypothetical protein